MVGIDNLTCQSFFNISNSTLSNKYIFSDYKCKNLLQASAVWILWKWNMKHFIALSCIRLPFWNTCIYCIWKKIKPFNVMLLWHISATRRHSKIFLWIMPTCKMISQHATLLYIYITKNCDSMSLFPVFYCCLLSYHLADLLFMQHIYI